MQLKIFFGGKLMPLMSCFLSILLKWPDIDWTYGRKAVEMGLLLSWEGGGVISCWEPTVYVADCGRFPSKSFSEIPAFDPGCLHHKVVKKWELRLSCINTGCSRQCAPNFCYTMGHCEWKFHMNIYSIINHNNTMSIKIFPDTLHYCTIAVNCWACWLHKGKWWNYQKPRSSLLRLTELCIQKDEGHSNSV